MQDDIEIKVACPSCKNKITTTVAELETDDQVSCPNCDFQFTFDMESLKNLHKAWFWKLAGNRPENPHLN